MSEEQRIQVLVLDTIMLEGDRIFPGDENEAVLVDLTQKDFDHLSKFGAVAAVGEIEGLEDAASEGSSPEPKSEGTEPETDNREHGSGNGDSGTEGAGGTEAPTPDEGKEAEITAQKIVEAIDTLKPEDYTQGGVPEVKALEAVLKAPISAAQRDEAWTMYQDAEGSE